jgi:hypothetical protein
MHKWHNSKSGHLFLSGHKFFTLPVAVACCLSVTCTLIEISYNFGLEQSLPSPRLRFKCFTVYVVS